MVIIYCEIKWVENGMLLCNEYLMKMLIEIEQQSQ